MSTTKVAFPPPPPTCNTLTVKQRNQLLRSTKKLGQVLGTTPHLLDESSPIGPLHVHLPLGNSPQRRQSLHRRRNSVDSVSSISSTSLDSAITCSSGSFRAPSKHSDTEPWRPTTTHRPPLLRLARSVSAVQPPSPTTTSPESLQAPASPTGSSSSYSSSEDTSYTLSINRRQSVNSLYLEEPVFVIPSESAARREKMDRLKRKLGSGVPVELVFPPPAASAPESNVTTPSAPPPVQQFQSQTRLNGHQRRVTVHYGPTTRSVSNADGGALGSIIESADEHGASCSEEFGYAATAVATKAPKFAKSSRTRVPPPNVVDVDIDAKVRGMMKNLGAKRKAWVRKGLADNEYTTLWL